MDHCFGRGFDSRHLHCRPGKSPGRFLSGGAPRIQVRTELVAVVAPTARREISGGVDRPRVTDLWQVKYLISGSGSVGCEGRDNRSLPRGPVHIGISVGVGAERTHFARQNWSKLATVSRIGLVSWRQM